MKNSKGDNFHRLACSPIASSMLSHMSVARRKSIRMTLTIALVLFYAFLLCLPLFCLASDTLRIGENLLDGSAKLVATGEQFELRFFSPFGSQKRYLGILYHGTVVWVANRDKPIPPSTNGTFQISRHGNLTLSDTNGTFYWSSTPAQVSSLANLNVKLMESGNLILGDDQTIYWQSFEHPTDTFLPGMKMDKHLVLNSWRDSHDPGTGNFTFASGKTGDSFYTIYVNYNQVHWDGEKRQDFGTEGEILSLLTNFTLTNFTFNNRNVSRTQLSFEFESIRLVMNYTGHVEFWRWSNIGGWKRRWKEPANDCNIYNHCGNFSSCNINSSPLCRCLPGFVSKSPEENPTPSSKYGGCFKKTTSCGQNPTTFIDLKNVKVRKPNKKVDSENEAECRSKCFNGTGCPNCTAYSYDASAVFSKTFVPCSIWTSDLPTLPEDIDSGINISVLVYKPDIEPTPRTCQPCGVFTIPYPLSTEPSCGDPFYFNFTCDLASGQVSFTVGEKSYGVTNIDPFKRSFSIQINVSEDCTASNLTPPLHPPFNATQQCDGVQVQTLKINWSPPNEPPCNNNIDCKGWSHSTCRAARNGNGRCLCNKKYQWSGLNLSCTPGPPRRTSSEVLILAVAFSSLIFLSCIVTSACIWRRKVTLKKENGQGLRTRESLHDSERYIKNFVDSEVLEEKDKEVIEVPFVDFNSILLATDNFSDANKLGRGGYGPVYKGKLKGEDIAVKRLSSVSSQGLKEFKNEVVLISKLQHRNLVRLRGHCITGDEKILLYEYLPNKSLDKILFTHGFDGIEENENVDTHHTEGQILDWQMRFDIILGVARGMVYLHQDSRLRVIHRDLKTSNILLDEDMQPKISDFGLAKIFGNKENEANTERIVGTYGYMAPEYALDGLLSIKADVFSFGIVVLEIMSGKKNTGFFQPVFSLMGYAWRLWAENKLLDLMDPSLSESCNNFNQFIRCAQVSLLCIQDEPGDRPTMLQVLIMLESDTASLPTPKQPTFFMTRDKGLSSSASSSKPEGFLPAETPYQEGR